MKCTIGWALVRKKRQRETEAAAAAQKKPVQPFEDYVKSGDRRPQATVPHAVVEQTDWRTVMKLLR